MRDDNRTYKLKHGASNGAKTGRHLAPKSEPEEMEALLYAQDVELEEEEASAPAAPARRRSYETRALRQSMPFYVTLAVMTILAWLIPLRPTVAEEEKRELAKMPEFTMDGLLDASYFAGIDTWFSDTFTGRRAWVSVNQKLESLHGVTDVVIYGDMGQKDDIPELPNAGSDTMENSQASATPALPAATDAPDVTDTPVVSAEPTPNSGETQAEDGTFGKDANGGWGGDSVGEGESLNTVGTLIQIGDTAYEWPGFMREAGENYAAQINRAGEVVGPGHRVFSLIAPFGASVMLTREFREETLDCTIEEDALTYLEGLMTGSNVYPVRVIDTLIQHNREYIYFRTDHHWTALGAYYAYTAWCESAGFTPVPLSEYEVFDQGDYLGTYYEAADQADLLGANPDQCIAYVPPGDISLYVTDYPDDSAEYLGEEMPVIFDERENPMGFKYFCFLAGDNAFSALVNDSIQDDSAVLVYKNSMGNPFVYYLTQHYHTVYVCDYRYYETRTLPEMIEEYGIDDVIFVNNTSQAEWQDSVDLVAGCIGW